MKGALDRVRSALAGSAAERVGYPTSAATVRDAAVVDVGSNSVRLVVYRVEGRAIAPVYNDRSSAGLGQGLARSGVLSPEGVAAATRALRRFRVCLDARGVRDVTAVATAAVREARDGDAFAAIVQRELGQPLRILSGPEEGRLAALGVHAGDPTAEGLVGDLGGSSLELAGLTLAGEAEDAMTLLVGPLALKARAGEDRIEAARLASEALAGAPDHKARTLYAVGGAWRNLARIDIAREGWPLKLLHGYAIPAARARKVAGWVAKQEPTAFEAFSDVSKKRAEALPWAAMVMDALLERYPKIKSVVISSYGVREGLLYDAMPAHERAGDPLLAGVETLARSQGASPAFWTALEAWLVPVVGAIAPVFGETRDAVLRAAACRLADFGARLHPDHRERLAVELVLALPVVGVSHEERAFLSAVMHHRYAGASQGENQALWERILDDKQRLAAQQLGALLRLGADCSGRAAGLLRACALSVEAGVLVLRASAPAQDLLTERVNKRLGQAATALGLAYVLDVPGTVAADDE